MIEFSWKFVNDTKLAGISKSFKMQRDLLLLYEGMYANNV